MANQSRESLPIGKYKAILILAWAAILLFCLLNKDRFTVDGVLAYTPENALLSAAFMLFLFALKSVSVFIFSGILFAANGILFPLPAAILLNILGAVIMVSLPYWLGRRLGTDIISRIAGRYPRVEAFRQLQAGHELIFSFITRAVSVLPSDILSLYMGAMGISYRKYLPGSILGMLLSLVTFPVMGMHIMDPGSPAFLWSIGIQAAVSAVFVAGAWIYHRRKAGEEK